MTQSGLRIIHIFRAPLGGLFRHVVDVARAQIERGHAVGIFCDSSTGGTRADAVLAELAPRLTLGVTRVPMRRNPHLYDLAASVALARLCRKAVPDILHGHGSKGGAYARLLPTSSLRSPAVRAYTPHGGSFNYQPGSALHGLYMRAERLLARRTDLFLFESAYIAGRFRTFVGETDRLVRIVPNGVGAAEFAPPARGADPFDLLYIGELRAAKGVETLLDAVAELRREGRRLTLLVVGSGPSEDELKARAKRAGIWDSVAFVPPRPIRDALGQARLMVVPSLAESLPYVVLEAAAAGQPMVATNVGGIPEIFGPLSADLIAPSDVGLLREAIRRKLDEPPGLQSEKTHALTNHIRSRFSLDRMVDGVLAGYEAAIAARDYSGRPALSLP
ncbi:MAG TPA: glycosyltransferase family 4 protein [Beijerinckiaceae bacterium]|jgi:glycosyltransferase involved in cell wall biosynthesis